MIKTCEHENFFKTKDSDELAICYSLGPGRLCVGLAVSCQVLSCQDHIYILIQNIKLLKCDIYLICYYNNTQKSHIYGFITQDYLIKY